MANIVVTLFWNQFSCIKIVQFWLNLHWNLFLSVQLTHWGRDKMAAILQTTLSNAISWMKMLDKILIKISLKFVPNGPINNIPALVQIMAWRWPGDKPLSEPMMVILQTHICIPRPQWGQQMVACTTEHTSHYLKQWCLVLLMHICIIWPQWVNS